MNLSSKITALLCSAVLAASLNLVSAQTKQDPRTEIDKAIQLHVASLAEHDMEGLQAATDTRLVSIEAGDKKAQVHISAADNEKEVLPPKGNDDWKKMVLSDVKTEISSTHPSVARASFILSFPLSEQAVTMHKSALESKPPEEIRKKLEQRIANRAIRNHMFAMLTMREGAWKIVCISLPK